MTGDASISARWQFYVRSLLPTRAFYPPQKSQYNTGTRCGYPEISDPCNATHVCPALRYQHQRPVRIEESTSRISEEKSLF